MINKKESQLFEVKKSLGPLESEVMKIIWGKNRTDVREVTGMIRKKRPIAYTTIMTIMDTLFKKGFLTRQKIGKAYKYKTVAAKNVFLKNALFSIVSDLIGNYGRTKVILSALRFNVYPVKQLRAPTISVAKIFEYKQLWLWRNKIPVGYGMKFTFLAIILFYSIWELFQNFHFFGTTEFINLAFIEPSLVFERFNLIFLAIIESLPMLNITATIILFTLFILAGKKLSKLLDITILPKLERLA